MDNFLAEGWKSWFKSTFYSGFLTHVELPRKLTHNFSLTTASHSKRSLQNWWTLCGVGLKSWFKSTSLPLSFFGRKFTLNFAVKILRSLQAVRYQAFVQKLMDNFLAEGWKVDSNQPLFTPLSFFLDENSRWTSPKSWSQFLRSLQPCSTKRPLPKIDGQLSSRGWW